MRVLPFLLASLVVILDVAFVQAAKGKSAVAVPRKVKGNAISRSVFGSMFSRAFREMKVTFCSELEALTLQLTRPSDTQVSLKNLDELVRCLNAEYDNPQFTVSLLAKFSRKLCEPNVFTKLKSLICLHKMMQECDSNAQNALTQSVRSLKSEKDEKVGVSFFSIESIEQAAGSASNVAELEAVELAREYASYVLNFVDYRGEKMTKNTSKNKKKNKNLEESLSDNEEKAELLLELYELNEVVQKCCKQSQNGEVVMQCLTCVMDDKSYLIKQMLKVYESGLDDEELETELEEALKKADSKFKSKSKLPLGTTKANISIVSKSETKSGTEKELEMKVKDVKVMKEVVKEVETKKVSSPSLSSILSKTSSAATAATATATGTSTSVPSAPIQSKSIPPTSTATIPAVQTSTSSGINNINKIESKTVVDKTVAEKSSPVSSSLDGAKVIKTVSTSSTTSTSLPTKKSTVPMVKKEKVDVKENKTSEKIGSKNDLLKKSEKTKPSSSNVNKKTTLLKKNPTQITSKKELDNKKNKLTKDIKSSKSSKTLQSKSSKKK